jgi:hypothetical protein
MGIRNLLAVLLILVSASALAENRQPDPNWTGWWIAPTSATTGWRLSIFDCDSPGGCKPWLQSYGDGQHRCPLSDTTATQTAKGLLIEIKYSEDPELHCSVLVRKSGDVLRLAAPPNAADTCRIDDCDPLNGTDVADFRLTTRQKLAWGEGALNSMCYYSPSKVVATLCTDEDLSSLVHKSAKYIYTHIPRDWPASQEFVDACEKSADIKSCLTAAYGSKVKYFARQSSTMEPAFKRQGDPGEARRLLDEISGKYLHHGPDFMGSDNIDSLEIRRTEKGKVSIDINIDGANGHICDLSGEMSYRASEYFVYDDHEEEQHCRMAVGLTGQSIDVKPLDDGCDKYCGARASWRTADFHLSDRIGQRQRRPK